MESIACGCSMENEVIGTAKGLPRKARKEIGHKRPSTLRIGWQHQCRRSDAVIGAHLCRLAGNYRAQGNVQLGHGLPQDVCQGCGKFYL